MGRDASLDEFIGGDGGTAGRSDDSDESGADDEPETGGEDGATDAGRSTFDWSPDGAPCGACGDRVERRWRDDGRLVCESCKEW